MVLVEVEALASAFKKAERKNSRGKGDHVGNRMEQGAVSR